MGVLALILVILAVLCAVMGILTGAEVISPVAAQFTATVWLMLGGILLLAAIACRSLKADINAGPICLAR